jgi:hypothetical protein
MRHTPLRFALHQIDNLVTVHRTKTRLKTLGGLEVWAHSKRHPEWSVIDDQPVLNGEQKECQTCRAGVFHANF